MLQTLSAVFHVEELQLLTEAEHDVEEYDQQNRDSIDSIAGRTHPKWPFWNILPAGEEMWPDGQSVGNSREDDERPHQVGKSGFAA